jgi:demethylmenaquinone methyltransferase / 2-methoxy-6-polyprenyl-1,4-benzoquinol methylase
LSQESVKGNDHARRVRQMFGDIAGRYDFFNHFFSINIDRRWRNAVARKLRDELARPDALVLDVACGTGDLSLKLSEKAAAGARVVGVDFCRPMLEIAARKANEKRASVPFIEGDALKLSFADETFDAVTIAFGLRNLSSVEKGLGELRRVLKPSGRLIVLEFSTPVVPLFREIFSFYFNRILPRIGDLFNSSRQQAYTYLAASVSKFPDQKRLAALMRAAGFEQVEYQNLTGGIAAIHAGTRAGVIKADKN